MGTFPVQRPNPVGIVAEQDDILRHDPHSDGRPPWRQFARESHRLPVTPQQFARGQNFTYDLADLGRYYLDYVELLHHFDAVLPRRVYRGHEGVRRSWERWLEQWEEYGFEAERFIDRGDDVLHIELRRWADLFVIAPLDANTLGKLAAGLADNCLTCVWRAWDPERPAVLAPAMNTLMWRHPATARCLRQLAADIRPIGTSPNEGRSHFSSRIR